MMTDGISEVPDENNEEFGLYRLEQLLRKNSAQPLPQLWELIMGEVDRHGVQQDDQTLLFAPRPHVARIRRSGDSESHRSIAVWYRPLTDYKSLIARSRNVVTAQESNPSRPDTWRHFCPRISPDRSPLDDRRPSASISGSVVGAPGGRPWSSPA